MPRSAMCVALLALSAHATSAPVGRTTTCSLAALKGFRLWESGSNSLARSKIPGNVRREFFVRLKNETRAEIAEVNVRLRVVEGGRTTVLSPVATLRRFDNTGFPHIGSLLPFNKSGKNTFVVDYPGRFWNTGSMDGVELVSFKTYVGAQDLRDTGHLFTFVANTHDKGILDRLKAQPSLLTARDSMGVGLMAVACAASSPTIVRYALGHGGDLRAKTTGGSTVAHAAAFNTDLGVLELLRAKGVAVDAPSRSGRTPLIKAIQVGNPLSAGWLLTHGADPNHSDKDDRTPMYYAINEGQTGIIEALVRAGANPRYHNRNGWSWMHSAGVHNYLVMPWTLRAGVSANDSDPRFGFTPLMAVARNGDYRGVPWLIAHGADPEAKDLRGLTAYDYARQANTLRTDRFFRSAVESARAKG